jgi:hypothetical protein
MLDMCREALERTDFVPLNSASTCRRCIPRRLNNLMRECRAIIR